MSDYVEIWYTIVKFCAEHDYDVYIFLFLSVYFFFEERGLARPQYISESSLRVETVHSVEIIKINKRAIIHAK